MEISYGATTYKVNDFIGPDKMLRFKPGTTDVLEVNTDYYADKSHPVTDSSTGLPVANALLHTIRGQLQGLNQTQAQAAAQQTSLVDVIGYQEHSTKG